VPDHVGQGADELRGGVAVALERLLVDHLADGEPEGGFEALGGLAFALCMGGLHCGPGRDDCGGDE
jgi:hypothetical protein